jgi:hypothetical protein
VRHLLVKSDMDRTIPAENGLQPKGHISGQCLGHAVPARIRPCATPIADDAGRTMIDETNRQR